jgi:aerobic-type carbon monoxide dehydrogenase small subunit (CoxS/CutS family)
MERLHVNRTSNFKWESREELYDYFQEKYNLSKEQIDEEVARCREEFALRKGEAVRTTELWQKVGCVLEDRYAFSTQKMQET